MIFFCNNFSVSYGPKVRSLLPFYEITRLLISISLFFSLTKQKGKEETGTKLSDVLSTYNFANLLFFFYRFFFCLFIFVGGAARPWVSYRWLSRRFVKRNSAYVTRAPRESVGIWIYNSSLLSIPWKLNASPVNGTWTATFAPTGDNQAWIGLPWRKRDDLRVVDCCSCHVRSTVSPCPRQLGPPLPPWPWCILSLFVIYRESFIYYLHP